jgi:hypothetical protein
VIDARFGAEVSNRVPTPGEAKFDANGRPIDVFSAEPVEPATSLRWEDAPQFSWLVTNKTTSAALKSEYTPVTFLAGNEIGNDGTVFVFGQDLVLEDAIYYRITRLPSVHSAVGGQSSWFVREDAIYQIKPLLLA